MLFTSGLLLNSAAENQFTIYPYIDDTCNNINWGDMVRGIKIPDIDTEVVLSDVKSKLPNGEELNFSMTAGEWIEIYKNQLESWDCVITCFFLDTAPVAMDYIETIHNILKLGGRWINFGPLQFHWANSGPDPRYEESIELSWEEMRHVIASSGFEIVKEEQRTTSYNSNIKSMLKTEYTAIFFTAQKVANK
mmetsp:Transcript_11127/g.15835  ORF Transcript_11127/g.15835 Transcript_11127/m.15835 type:complete len:192 (+) Transcript_11127:512-1087(+)